MADMYEKWDVTNHGGQYDVVEIKYGSKGVSFVVADDKNSVKSFNLTWPHENLIAYNVTDETYRADWWKRDFAEKGRFYMSYDSEYLNFYRSKSPLFPQNAIHFVIIGTNTIADILATAKPEVE